MIGGKEAPEVIDNRHKRNKIRNLGLMITAKGYSINRNARYLTLKFITLFN
jgi:hypothetical protein